jgi:hypothetical protein
VAGHQPTVADQIAAVLERHQVEVIFGQSVPPAVLLAHPPVSLYDGTLGKQAESGSVQHAVG